MVASSSNTSKSQPNATRPHSPQVQPPSPHPGSNPQPMTTTTTPPTTATKAGQEQIAAYLDSNPEFLENYVIANVDLETVERWVIRKARSAQRGNGGKYILSAFLRIKYKKGKKFRDRETSEIDEK